MDMNIGQYLSSLRIEKNLTLEEVSEITKIKTRILQSIEDNRFDDLGGLGYVKALLVSYSKVISADEVKVLKMLDETYKGIQLKYSKPLPDQPRKKYHFHMNFIYIIFLLILIAVLTFFIFKLNKEGKLDSPLFRIFSKDKIEKTDAIEDSTATEEPEIIEEVESTEFDDNALHDKSDYTSQLLFEGKDSPFKYDE